jgi:hypothetical protein
MVNFKEVFKKIEGEEYPQKRHYKGKTIFLADKFPVMNEEKLIFSIEKTNSDYPQGFVIGVYDGYIKTNGKAVSRKRKHVDVLFWEDSEVLDIKHIEIQVITDSDHIFIQNLWEKTIYEQIVIDGTKPAGENRKTIRFPEGKKVSCYVGSDRWMRGKENGAAMYSEDIPNGKRYFCNDGDEDEDFDDIIFTVKRVD